MRPDDDQLGDYKEAMDNLKNAKNCDSCGKSITPGTGYSVPTKRGGSQNFHKDANECAAAPNVREENRDRRRK